IEGDDKIILAAAPADVNVALVGGRRRTGETVIGVLAGFVTGKLTLPELLAAGGFQTDEDALAALFLAAADKKPLTPDDRRGMADAGQLHLPVDALLAPARCETLDIANAAAVRATEARPVLSRQDGRKQAADHQGECRCRQLHEQVPFISAAQLSASSFRSG